MSNEDLRHHVCERGERWAEYDGHGIFLCYVCDKCKHAKIKQFRHDIRTRYDADEPIDGDDA